MMFKTLLLNFQLLILLITLSIFTSMEYFLDILFRYCEFQDLYFVFVCLFLPAAVIKCSNQTKLKERRFICALFQGYIAEKTWQ
jgi:hypothetical protein